MAPELRARDASVTRFIYITAVTCTRIRSALHDPLARSLWRDHSSVHTRGDGYLNQLDVVFPLIVGFDRAAYTLLTNGTERSAETIDGSFLIDVLMPALPVLFRRFCN